MILQPNWAGPPTPDSPIIDQISAEISAVCGTESLLQPGDIEELARAVAVFVEREYGGMFEDSRTLLFLASRALTTLGQGQVARRLVVFGTGLVRPAEWEVTGEDSMWVLDLRRMTVLDDFSLELVFFRSLDLILEAIAGVWDDSDGAGVLGLHHVSATAMSLMGPHVPVRDVRSLVAEIKDSCHRRLQHLRADRGWTETPFIMDLDL